uniref:brefeldin A-inhibited guanine nucleotide-exchange protein 3-like isoform X2 n=1 Tax=Ciona intestinalis TaxID=7719 RepID=UPI00089DC701|nr:brefeldin A-inhibited guanine nucleotide-exchange protein 3-like isoform X2 [Ciona intestinalis]|eukprot:XP_018671977.1 brefeldin A-inhibited guanine nucleotide-exchange protein 3-like isoform X2 [Ciona intestinalis]
MAGLSIENHLKILAQSTSSQRYRPIYENVQLTLDTLDTQKLSYAFKGWQIREKCVSVFKDALESHNPNLSKIALQGLEHVVFHPYLDGITGEEELDAMDARIFVLQVLDSLKCLPLLNAEQQVHGIKILLGLCCDFVPSFDGELIIKIVQMCLACWHKDKPMVHSAMLQLCAAYTLHTQKFCTSSCSGKNVDSGVMCAAESLSSRAVEKLAINDVNTKGNQVNNLVDVTGLAKFFAQQIERSEFESQQALHLECLLSVLKTLRSNYVRTNSTFCHYVSHIMCPCLTSVLSISSKRKVGKIKKSKRRKMKNFYVTPSLMVHRKVAMLCVELVRLLGCVASMRPHIAVIFTHLLSPPACRRHGFPYTIINQLWTSPDVLYDLAGPFLVHDMKGKQNQQIILQIIIQALLLSSIVRRENSTQMENIQLCVSSVNRLLSTIERARKGEGLRTEQVTHFSERKWESELSDDELSGNDEEVVSPIQEDMDQEDGCGDQDVEEECMDGNEEEAEISQSHEDSIASDELENYLSEEGDIWVSSEDLRLPSSPCYLSAAEDQEDLQSSGTPPTSKLYRMMRYFTHSPLSYNKHTSASTTPTTSIVQEEQDLDNEENIDKYIEDTVLPMENAVDSQLLDSAEEERNRILSQRHINSLVKLLPQLLDCPDVASVDQILQKAASHFCCDMYGSWHIKPMYVQADSLYTLSYSILLLSLRLKLNGYYDGTNETLPCVKSQWVGYQQSSGAYLSASWLSETFNLIITTDLLGDAGYITNTAPMLVCVLTDIDGLEVDSSEKNINNTDSNSKKNIAKQAGSEFGRQVSVVIWNKILKILRQPLRSCRDQDGIATSLFLILSPSSLRCRSEYERESIDAALQGLRCAVKLSSQLELYSYAGVVFTQMVEACVPLNYFNKTTDPDDSDELQLHICHVLCMDAVLDVALQVASHSPQCWEAFFKVVAYIAYLDHVCFNNPKASSFNRDVGPSRSSLLNDTDIQTLVEENSCELSWDTLASGAAKSTSLGFLTPIRTVQAVCSLSAKIEKLLEQAAEQLNLRTLTDFIWHLCQASNHQLFPAGGKVVQNVKESRGTPLLYRLGECLLRCTKSSTRPLLHITNVWHFAAPHLSNATCHPETAIAKQSVSFIHDAILSILSSSDPTTSPHPLTLWKIQEPKYFYFSEALLRPFERSMQLENCDAVIQDQIISCISQLVESCSNQLCSGWRPLFNALRNANVPHQRSAQHSPVLDVLHSFFLASKQASIFAYAAHDCIKCLMKILTTNEENGSRKMTVTSASPILQYLEEVADILIRMHNNKSSEMFQNSKIDVTPSCSGDGSVWSALTTPCWEAKEGFIEDKITALCNVTEKCFPTKSSEVTSDNVLKPTPPPHTLVDDTGLLHVWFALMDGLTTSVLTSQQSIQAYVLQLLCKQLEKCWKEPGPMHCFHILLHSCIPTLYMWMNRLVSIDHTTTLSSSGILMNYKLMFGTIMEMAANYISMFLKSPDNQEMEDKNSSPINKVMENTWIAYLNLCYACIKTKKEPLAKLGCSCLRHMISSNSSHMTSRMIDDLCTSLPHAVNECLAHLNNITSMYEGSSGMLDAMTVEVQDTGTKFCDGSLLSRIFQACSNIAPSQKFKHQEVTIINQSSDEQHKTPLCELACDISSTQLLTQCIELLLLGDEKVVWESASSVTATSASNQHAASGTTSLHSTIEGDAPNCNEKTDGKNNQSLLYYMTSTQVHELTSIVAKVYISARNFDSIPTLQRLVQKLAKFYTPAHLYQFTSSTFKTYLRIILSICCQSLTTHSIDSTKFTPSPASCFVRKSNSLLQVENILPSCGNSKLRLYNELKSDSMNTASDSGQYFSNKWPYEALYCLLLEICQPWIACANVTSPSNDSLLLLQQSPTKSTVSNVSSSDTEEIQSPVKESVKPDTEKNAINFDYMTYVKKSDIKDTSSTGLPKQPLTQSWMDKRVYKVAGQKTIGLLVSAYKKHKQKQGATTIINQNPVSSNRSNNNATIEHQSDESFSSLTLPADNKSVEHEMWTNTVIATLRLLISAPDSVLSKLLPVLYQPLATLATNSKDSQSPNSSSTEIGSMFHTWLLRVGDLCQILTAHDAVE